MPVSSTALFFSGSGGRRKMTGVLRSTTRALASGWPSPAWTLAVPIYCAPRGLALPQRPPPTRQRPTTMKGRNKENTMNTATIEQQDTVNTLTPEMQALKTRLKATWMAGDYGHFASYMEVGAT